MSDLSNPTAAAKQAILYRMVLPEHVCPWGLKAKDLLGRAGYDVEDLQLTTRAQADAFKDKHRVATTPQVLIGGERIGGYEDLRRFLGKPVRDFKSASYRPVFVLFALSALAAAAAGYAATGELFSVRIVQSFIAISMIILAMLKLQDVEAFSAMFLNYDLLARHWVPYSYIYPYAEAVAGLLMIAGAATWLSAPIALFIGSLGAVSVFKAVYIEGREFKCACVGGSSNVPLGFVSLTENMMMIAMAIWMGGEALMRS